jgi:Tfp pilus assembly protein PilX
MTPSKGERGVVLLYALIFTTAIALVVTALLSQSEVEFRAVDAYRDRRNGEFAADAGLERALSTIGMFAAPAGSGGGATCTDPATCPLTPALESHKEVTGNAPVTVSSVAVGRARHNNRLVVVATGTSGTSSVSGVTLGGTPMLRADARTAQGCWLIVPLCAFTTEIWYQLDAALPATAGAYPVVVSGVGGRNVAVQVSSWVGVLQDVSGVPHVPTTASTGVESGAGQVTTSVTSVGANTVLVSAAGHADTELTFCSTNDNLTGTGAGTRLANGPHPSCGGFGTSYALRGSGPQAVTETFAASSSATAHVVAGFRAASSAPPPPPVFGATCTGSPMAVPAVNGYTVVVTCQMTSSSTLAVTATATRGTRVSRGSAVITRHDDGMVEVTSWETRPDAAT